MVASRSGITEKGIGGRSPRRQEGEGNTGGTRPCYQRGEPVPPPPFNRLGKVIPATMPAQLVGLDGGRWCAVASRPEQLVTPAEPGSLGMGRCGNEFGIIMCAGLS